MSLRCITATLTFTVELRDGESNEDAMNRIMREKFGDTQPKIVDMYEAPKAKCEGCIHEEPGQRAHMGNTGCLSSL